MYTYTTINDQKAWTKVTQDGHKAVPYTIRETGKEGDFIAYEQWQPALYGGGELLRGRHPDKSLTATGYIKIGTPIVMRVTNIPQNPDK